jgi:hypothetical protein
LKQWYRLLLRTSSFLNLGLRERGAIALLELCSELGVEESRGTLLTVSLSHKDIADLGGATAAKSHRTSGRVGTGAVRYTSRTTDRGAGQ